MVMTDPIADMLSRIRNAQKAKFLTVSFPYSNIKYQISKVLYSEGYIKAYTIKNSDDPAQKSIELELKYLDKGLPGIVKIDKVSTPGRRIYSSIKDLKEYYKGLGIYVLSTSKGIVSDRDAVRYRVGGEVICKVF
jgi:small subunit ribosomal protein S8